MSTRSPPLVSVVIPTYNVGPYVRRCIESLLHQTYSNLELLAIDDRSTDNTAAILDELAAAHPQLHVVHLAENVGVHAARAAGVRLAAGEYLGFVDGDDWVDAEMFASLASEASVEQADIVICGAACAISEHELGAPKVRFLEREVITSDILSRFCRLQFGSGVLWNKLYRAALLRPHALTPLERRVDAAEDYIVNFGAFSSAGKVVTLPEAYYFYFLNPTSATRSSQAAAAFSRTVRAYVVCLEKHSQSSPSARRLIDMLYTLQLQFETYAVADTADLEPYEAELRETLERLAKIHPAGIYSLIQTFHQPPKPNNPGRSYLVARLRRAPRALVRKLAGTR
jgi:glycosyltransferase involved in cell wall biosynthesis